MTKVLGVDLAYCNVIADGGYQVMYDGGVRFAYIKQTQGNRIYDSQFDKHWKGVSDTKILRGVYHVYEPLVLAKQQMNFINPVCPLSAELPFALDVEIDLQATNAYLLKEVHDFLVLLEEHFGRKPIIYTGKWWWEPNMSPAAPWVGNYDFWIASYPYAAGRVDLTWEQLPTILPTGWAPAVTNGRKPIIWQFSGDKFFLPGISGALDLNMFDGDENTMRQWASLPIVKPPLTLEERLVLLEAEARTRGWKV
jgi:lysozyme